MKKIKMPSKNEVVGSAGIALAFFFGAVAVNQEVTAENAAAVSEQYSQESQVAGEGGIMGAAYSADEWSHDMAQTEHHGHDAAGLFGALGVVALGLGINAYRKQILEDSKADQFEHSDNSAKVPDTLYHDDATREIRLAELPPVPPVLQKS